MLNVSIIVPVYNASKWIELCAQSLFGQTMKHGIEYIFVNDHSQDNSIEILESIIEKHPSRKAQVKILQHDKNLGVAAARTTGMIEASGEYMIHCDPDDWVEPEMYETMYHTAIENNADIVVCDYYTEGLNRKRRCHGHYTSDKPSECLSRLYERSFFPSLCCTLIKTSIIHGNDIYPFSGINTGEDLNVLFRVFHYGKKLVHLDCPFYHYNRHDGSLSMDKDVIGLFDKNIYNNISELQEWADRKGGYEMTISYLKFKKKLFLLQGKDPDLKRWLNTWPECHKDIMKFKSIPIKTRYIYKFCSKSYIVLYFYFKVIRNLL